MLKATIIGHIGADAVLNQHGTDSVLNWSTAHTDRYKDASGQQHQKTTWVSCSWWVDGSSKVGQYLKKGQMVYIEGIPEARMWDGKDGKKACGLSLRVLKLEFVGGRKDDSQSESSSQVQESKPSSGGYSPYNSDDQDVPF